MVEILVMRLFKPMVDRLQVGLHQPVLGQSVWGASQSGKTGLGGLA
jgi:hypothetical protein